MSTTIAVINWNSGKLLRACLDSLLATTKSAEIVVIDNASTDSSLEFADDMRNRIDFIRNSVNRGFAAAVNQAFQTSSSSYVLVLNPDVTALPGSVQILEDFMDRHARAAAVGAFVGEKYPPRQFPTAGRLVLENLGVGRASHSAVSRQKEAIPVDQPAAAALMIRRDAYEDVEGFDERFFPAWYEDVDFCRRLKAKGWEIFFMPAAEFSHAGGYSAAAMGSERFVRAYYQNQLRYAKKHFGAMGSLATRLSIAAGMIGRMLGRPRDAAAYGRALLGALKEW